MALRIELDVVEGLLKSVKPLLKTAVTINTDKFQDTRTVLAAQGQPGDTHTGQVVGDKFLLVRVEGKATVSITVPGVVPHTLQFDLEDDFMVWGGPLTAFSVSSTDTLEQVVRVING